MEQYGRDILNKHLKIKNGKGESNKYLCISNLLFEYLNSMCLIEQLKMLKKDKDHKKCEESKKEFQEDFMEALTSNSNDTENTEKIDRLYSS